MIVFYNYPAKCNGENRTEKVDWSLLLRLIMANEANDLGVFQNHSKRVERKRDH